MNSLIIRGVVGADIKTFLGRFDDGDGRVSFDEFFTHMRRVWVFGLEVMELEGRIVREKKENGFGAGGKEAEARRRTKQERRAVAREVP
jgi:hypothetical protein